MNIFFLRKDPRQAAIDQCDKHAVKMPLESAQMLCTAYRRWCDPLPKKLETQLYKKAYINHPMTIWAGDSTHHYAWLYQPDVIAQRVKNDELRAEGRKVGEEGPLIDEFNRTTRNVVDALERAPGALLKSSAGTWWGALNAVTYVEDHMRGGENKVYNSLIGDGSKRKEKAYRMALEYAEAA